MSNLSYTAPKARRVRTLAKREEFQDPNGEPDVPKLAGQVKLSQDAVRFILTGKLFYSRPGSPSASAPEA